MCLSGSCASIDISCPIDCGRRKTLLDQDLEGRATKDPVLTKSISGPFFNMVRTFIRSWAHRSHLRRRPASSPTMSTTNDCFHMSTSTSVRSQTGRLLQCRYSQPSEVYIYSECCVIVVDFKTTNCKDTPFSRLGTHSAIKKAKG